MALPELYRFGREGSWFSMKWFVLYMLDGVYQVCSSLLFFVLQTENIEKSVRSLPSSTS